MFHSTLRSLSLAISTVLLGSCTDALLQPLPVNTATLDDRLELTGHICTNPPNINDFPVKVVFIVDESGSMCVSDPPGSQQQSGFCEMPQVIASWPPGQTQPGRVRAIEQMLNQFCGGSNCSNPNSPTAQTNVQVAILPFETSPMTPWPPAGGFAPPDSTAITFCDQLQGELGNGTDTQGVLETAYTLIANDIETTSKSAPEKLPRSRYEIVFLTDGVAFPHCTASTNLPATDYATPDQPWLIWEDDSQYCTEGPPQGQANNPSQQVIVAGQAYVTNTDLNQNYQIFDAVKQIMTLKGEYNVGDIRLDTVLLLSEQAVQICGPMCTDVYGTWPGLNPATYPQDTVKAASWLLQQMAILGNGTYQQFLNGAIQTLSVAGLDYASLSSPIVMKNLFVQAMTSVPSPTGRVFDSDGDGLPDTVDNTFTAGTNTFDPDTDGDCFDDGFEVLQKANGFNPVCADPRGCYTPGSCQGPASCNSPCFDGDGDGLPDLVEQYLGSNVSLADSSGDGVPDPIKARYGFDPTVAHQWQTTDTDGDGISDWDEIRANTDPTVPDAALFATDGYQYQITGTPQSDGSTCYDFTISNLKLLQTPSHSGQTDGYNLFKVWFDEAPESSLDTDYGYWRAACAWAQYSPPDVRVPAGSQLSLNKADGTTYFVDLHSYGPALGTPTTACAGSGP